MAKNPIQRNAPARSAPAAAVAPEAPPPEPAVVPEELLERRRFNRTIPVAQVIECNEEDAWELWSQWSSL